MKPPRWKVVCAYDGGAFSGWQSQARGGSVQDAIEARLQTIFGRDVRIHGSGRTDAGVHARAQVFHFDAEWRHGPAKLTAALRDRLPPAIQIASLRRAAPDFHARFDAAGKIYSYHLHFGDADPFTRPYAWVLFKPVNWPLMVEAAGLLRGKHDFRAFSAWNGAERESTVRDLRRLELRRRGRRGTIVAEADGFLYKMMRSLVGALVSVGEGKLGLEEVRQLLKGGHRTAAVQTAPPLGLFLERVLYR
jgi:tRNA pseudouridine38-40 synthase